jgi:hypothetical protein
MILNLGYRPAEHCENGCKQVRPWVHHRSINFKAKQWKTKDNETNRQEIITEFSVGVHVKSILVLPYLQT